MMNANTLSLDGWQCSQEHQRTTADGASVLDSVWQNSAGAILTVRVIEAPDEETARGLLRSRVEVSDSLKERLPPASLGDEAFAGPHDVALRSGATVVIVKHVHGEDADVLAVARRVVEHTH